jgi:predicted TIM-barrel fold metal-dependent hydrolase
MAQTQGFCVPAINGRPGSLKLRPEMRTVKLIGVEEHVTFPNLFRELSIDNHASRQLGARMGQLTQSYAGERLPDIADQRLKDMNENGVAVQILSLSSAINSTHLGGEEATRGVALARDVNTELKKAVDANPTRFRAFAELPMHVPQEAIKELRRCVTELGFVGAMLSGSVSGEGKFLDAPEFDSVLSTFEELDVPLFLHPGVPAKAVWEVSVRFGLGGWGWHNEVAVHVLRLVLSGTLDRHPRLKIIIGHLGEMLPSMMQRVEEVFDATRLGLERSVGETLRSQVWISISGFFTLAQTQAAIATWGVGKVIFANDYPFVNMNRVGEYIRALGELVSPSDLRKICQTNIEDLLKIKA